MSGKITPQSQERMNRRDEFVGLLMFNNIDIMKKGDPLPIAEIRINGLPQHFQLAERILEILERELPRQSIVTGPRDQVIDLGSLSVKTRKAA